MKVHVYNPHGTTPRDKEIDSSYSSEYYSCKSLKDSMRLLELPLDNDRKIQLLDENEGLEARKKPFFERLLEEDLDIEGSITETLQEDFNACNLNHSKPLEEQSINEACNDEEFYEAKSYFEEDCSNKKETESAFTYDQDLEPKQGIENTLSFGQSFENELGKFLLESQSIDHNKWTSKIDKAFNKLGTLHNDSSRVYKKVYEGENKEENSIIYLEQENNGVVYIRAEWDVPNDCEEFIRELTTYEAIRQTIRDVERLQERETFIGNNGDVFSIYNISFENCQENKNFVLIRAWKKLDDKTCCEVFTFESTDDCKENEYKKEKLFRVPFGGYLIFKGSQEVCKRNRVCLYYETNLKKSNLDQMNLDTLIDGIKKYVKECNRTLGRQ